MTAVPSTLPLEAVADAVRSRLGLDYSLERHPDLLRALRAAAGESGAGDPAALASTVAAVASGAWSEALASALAAHLTVGETYFFRERRTLEVLAGTVLPQLVGESREEGRALRIWSAGCCTGEEPYTVAMLLADLLPEGERERAVLLGTDLNGRFLETARSGEYGSWSLRETSAIARGRFFTPAGPRRWRLRDEVLSRVSFRVLNLASGDYPCEAGGTAGVDLVLCRNVLMYLAPETVVSVLERFYRALRQGGWLVVSPVEVPLGALGRFTPVDFDGTTFFRKAGPALPPGPAGPLAPAPGPAPLLQSILPPAPRAPGPLPARSGPAAGAGAAAVTTVPTVATAVSPLAGRVRELAGAGRIGEALGLADRLVEEDPMHAPSQYVRAVVLAQTGDDEGAWGALSRAVYLDPGLAVAHVALGALARRTGRDAAARRAFRNALAILDGLPPGEKVTEGDGMTAADLALTVRALGGGGAP